jgi:hypothetical protein
MTPKKPKAKKKAKPVYAWAVRHGRSKAYCEVCGLGFTREIVKKVAEWIGKSSA